MDKHNWTEDIKSRITDFECDAPKGLWEGIDGAISEMPKARSARRSRFYRRWAAGAVAFASIALVFFILKSYQANSDGLTTPTDFIANVVANNSLTVSTDTTQNVNAVTADTKDMASTDTYIVNEHTATDIVRTDLLADAAQATKQTSTASGQANTAALSEETQEGDAPEQKIDVRGQSESGQEETTDAVIDINDWEKAETPRNPTPKRGRLTLNVYGSGSAGKENSTINRSSVAASLGADGTDWLGDPRIGIELYNQGHDTKTTEKHHVPVRVGIGLSYALNRHLSLDTGLELALLHSEFTDGTEQNFSSLSQTLRYIGLPIDLRWNFFTDKDLNIYAKCGVLVQKCICGSAQESYTLSGSTLKGQTNRRSELPWQFSAQTGIGAEYKLWRRTGLYAEFDAGFYLDDACNIRNIYQSRPFNCSLNFGIRVDMSFTR